MEYCMCVKSLQSCLTLCDPMDCSSKGSPVHGVLQARILEWVATASSRGLPNPGIKPTSCAAPALQADSLPLSPEGSTSSYRPIQFYPTLRKPFLVPIS